MPPTPDATDSAAKNVLSISDLMDVDSGVAPVAGSHLVWDAATGEYKATAQAAAVADITTADGSDPATTQALANASKAKINDLLAKLRTAKVLAP